MKNKSNNLSADATLIMSKKYDIISTIKSICKEFVVEGVYIELTVECNVGTELMSVSVHKIELEDDDIKLYALGEFCDLVYIYASDLTIDNWVALAYGLKNSDIFEDITEQ